MTTSADGRGGRPPPRLPAPGKPQQWFVLRPWLFDVTVATRLLRAALRPARPLAVEPWARAYGLYPDPGGSPYSVPLIGPGPDFDPLYAMGTDLDEPLIIASVTADGSGQPYPAAPRRLPPPVQGRPARPRAPAVARADRRRDPGHPPRRGPRPAPPPGAARGGEGGPAMITVTKGQGRPGVTPRRATARGENSRSHTRCGTKR